MEQPCYTLINFPTDLEPCNEMQLKLDLEKGDTKKKIEALKKTIGIILSGEKIPGLLMIIIRFVLPLQDHMIKKLLLIFWEIVPKTSPDGKLLQEMILVCDAYRKDLQHPNEFIRGSTLRFLCKLKEPELLEPLMPAIRACLEHRHSYVRRNAVLAIFTIYRNFEFLIPDAPELVANFLETEQDMSCKRNAFLMLLHADQERALTYLSSRLDNVHSFGDILQLVIVELIYKVCHTNPSERSRFIRTVYGLLALPDREPHLLEDVDKEREPKRQEQKVEIETGITFSQLAGAGASGSQHDMFELALNKALQGRSGGEAIDRGKLCRVRQLTGCSDPVYAEAIVSVNQYDIVLDVLLVNQTDDTLQNCCVELATLGELRLVERAAEVVLAPRDFASLRAHVKVASTENGVIFGNVVYEVTGASMDRGVVVLNDIHIDIVDFIQPAHCSDADFRQMWAEFEWENKVSVNTNMTDLHEYLQHLLASTNMKCLTPEKALSGQCGFMAANLYARSIFGEDALANLSIERPLHKPGAPVLGHVRIRAKTQGMALSLGDKINMMQKASHQKPADPTPAA